MSTILGELAAPGVKACIRVDEWSPMESGYSVEHHISLYTPPYHRGCARFLESKSDRFIPLSPVFYRPAGFTMEGKSNGGRTRALRCSFSDQRFQQTSGPGFQWQLHEIDRGLRLERSPIMPLMVRIAEEVKNPGFASEMILDALLTTMIVELIRYLHIGIDTVETRGRLSPAQFNLLRDRIQADNLQAPNVPELAELCAVSERHLLRLFKNTTGRTLSECIREAQTARAIRLIGETDFSVNAVAYQLGFTAPSAFSSAFKKAMGESPRDYRKRLRGSLT